MTGRISPQPGARSQKAYASPVDTVGEPDIHIHRIWNRVRHERAYAVVMPQAETPGKWTTWTLITRYKVAAIIGALLLVVLVAIILGGILTSRALVVSDSTTCSSWTSANQTEQRDYGARYVDEHGALRGGGSSPADVVAAINRGCQDAFTNDVEDTVNVVDAIKEQ